jgi:hypothetical protein
MILLAYFHGEGILFSFVIHVFFALLGGAVLLYGLVRYKSLVGAAVAIGYVALTLIVAYVSQGNLLLEWAGGVLTLPWNIVLPCYGLESHLHSVSGRGFHLRRVKRGNFIFLDRLAFSC